MENNPTFISGKPVNVGFESENFQVKEVGGLVQESWPQGELIYSPNAVSDPRDYKVDFTLLKSIFPNFEPEHPLHIGIPELRKHLMKIGYSMAERDSKRYVRLVELKERIKEISE
jgi:hypothetical protein